MFNISTCKNYLQLLEKRAAVPNKFGSYYNLIMVIR